MGPFPGAHILIPATPWAVALVLYPYGCLGPRFADVGQDLACAFAYAPIRVVVEHVCNCDLVAAEQRQAELQRRGVLGDKHDVVD